MLVLQNGASFNIFSGAGIEILTRDLAKKFGIKISRENMRQEIQTLAEKKRSDLRSDLNGKLIFLKVDGASRHRRSFLGVNTQFFSSGKILIKTLAVIDMPGTKLKIFKMHLKTYLISLASEKNKSLELVLTMGLT